MKNYFTDGIGVETFYEGQELKHLQNKIAKIGENRKEPLCEKFISITGKKYLRQFKRKSKKNAK